MKAKRRFRISLLITALFILAITSRCESESIYQGNSPVLTFSTDTLAFDTVFSTLGSATRYINVYNPLNEDVIINKIELAGGSNSFFRLNIDGRSSNVAENIKLKEKDSLRIFVEVTIDPTGNNQPVFILDSILFNVNQSQQQIFLSAFGQDVIKLTNKHLKTSTLTSAKPYLIYDTLFIDKNETVTIEPGAQFYMNRGSRVIVNGTLDAVGTLESPISFQGNRLEEWYDEATGLWGEIYLTPSSKNSSISYLNIKQATNGLVCDSIGLNSTPISISNVRIELISYNGLLAQNSNLNISNSLFSNCSKHAIYILFGGNYRFTHCTVGNYSNDNLTRTSPSVYLNNYYTNNGEVITNPLTEASFLNSIITGSNIQEIGFDFETITGALNDGGNYLFQNSLISVDKNFDVSDTIFYKNIITNKDPKFLDKSNRDFHLDSTSVVINSGDINLSSPYPSDYDKIDRLLDGKTDMGMYEYFNKP